MLYEETRAQRNAFKEYKKEIDELMQIYRDSFFLELRKYKIQEWDEIIISALI